MVMGRTIQFNHFERREITLTDDEVGAQLTESVGDGLTFLSSLSQRPATAKGPLGPE
jgi:hypothetical protein